MDFERQHFDCQCTCYEHALRFTLDQNEGEIWIDVHLSDDIPWYKRVLSAVKYVLGSGGSNQHHAETILRSEDHDRIRKMLDAADETRRSHHENSDCQDGMSTLPIDLNIREVRVLERVVASVRYSMDGRVDRPSYEGIHTLYPKIVDAHERLLINERINREKDVDKSKSPA